MRLEDQHLLVEILSPLEDDGGPFDLEVLAGPVPLTRAGLVLPDGQVRVVTRGHGRDRFVLYATCQLSYGADPRQPELPQPRPVEWSTDKRHLELCLSADDEAGALALLSHLSRLAFRQPLVKGLVLDLRGQLPAGLPLAGALFEELYKVKPGVRWVHVLRVHGLSAAEVELGLKKGAATVLRQRKKAGVYPHTVLRPD